MTDFSMSNMDYAPVKFMIKVFEANYPESLGVVLVHKAPWIFSGIWRIIKPWLDPVVAQKVQFTSNLKDLEEYVPRDHIPKDMGGAEDWVYEYVEPRPDVEDALLAESDKEAVEKRRQLEEARAGKVKEYERLTQVWVHHGDAATTGQDGDVAKQRADVAEALRKGYWELDPYVRARSLYDRTGIIGRGGEITFYPQSGASSGPAVNGTAEKAHEGGVGGGIPAQAHSADDVD